MSKSLHITVGYMLLEVERDVCVVINMHPVISFMPGGGMPIKGVQPVQVPQTLDVHAL